MGCATAGNPELREAGPGKRTIYTNQGGRGLPLHVFIFNGGVGPGRPLVEVG